MLRSVQSLGFACLLIFAGVLTIPALPATAQQTLLFEDFEGLPMSDSPLASDNDNETDWTGAAPNG